MAPTVITASLSSAAREAKRRVSSMKFYMVEVTDYDGDQTVYHLDARSEREAYEGALALATSDGVQVNMMFVYEF